MIPFLKSATFDYTRLKGVIWCTDGLEHPTCVTASACKACVSWLGNQKAKRPLVVNCSGMRSIADHALDGLATVIEDGHCIIFTNTDAICGEIIGQYPDKTYPRTVFGDRFIIFGKVQPVWAKPDALDSEIANTEHSFIEQALKDSFELFPEGPRRLASTPFLANGVCDLGKILSDPSRFLWVSLLMAERFEKFVRGVPAPAATKVSGELRLLAVSLRASPMAVAVALLSEQKVDIIDHMGPIQRILEEDRIAGAARRRSYVFIADFLVGGTELKIAKTFAYLRGSEVCHALAFGSYLASEDYTAGMEIDSLGNMKKSCTGLTLQF
jgi:hypothetical protein